MKESTLYPILRRLEAAGALTVTTTIYNGRTRKYYAITPLGREKVAGFLSEWEELMRVYCFIKEVTT
ncbi:MAG: PadR family transcriptional regulator [bacterium]